MQPCDEITVPCAAAGDAERLAAILDLNERLFFCRDLAAVTAVVRKAARRLTGADGITFVLRDGDLCHYVDEDAISPLWTGQRFPMSACISGWAMLTGQPAVIPDIYTDARIPHDAYRPTFVRSLVMMPVGAPDPIAAIGAYWATRHSPSDANIALLRAIARSAALALSNVRLMESLRVAAETAQIQAAELARANATRARLLGAISHDLRQPVNALVLTHAALSSQVTDHRGRILLGNMEHGFDALRGLLDGLRDLTQLDGGRIVPEVTDVPLGDLLAHVEAMFRPAAEAKGLRWHLDAEGGGRVVRTDQRLTKRMLQNLIDNAIKYTAAGEIRVTCRATGDVLWVDVVDTGRGIPSGSLANIYEEFFRVDTGVDSQGLGLGLSIVKGLADLLGHRLAVVSQPGCGTTFSLEVPLVSQVQGFMAMSPMRGGHEPS